MSAFSFTTNNFNQEVLSSELPVLVDFWAPWCGPCRMLAPVIDEIAAENIGKAKVGKVNVDENQELATQFGVMSIPTLVLIKNGRVVDSMVGVHTKNDIQKMLQK